MCPTNIRKNYIPSQCFTSQYKYMLMLGHCCASMGLIIFREEMDKKKLEEEKQEKNGNYS